MLDQQTSDLESLIESLESAGGVLDPSAMAKVAETLSILFAVKQDEVAVLKVVPKYKSLMFVLPEKLSHIGTIPLSSATALASRTARERRPDLINNFSTARHANVFEAVPLGRDPSELIQKIMSAPILDGKQIRGVVQISRKAASLAETGPDFTQDDLRALVSLSPTLQRMLKLCKAD